MRALVVTGVIFVSLFFNDLRAQGEEKVNQKEHPVLLERVESENPNLTSKEIVVSKKKSDNLPNPNEKVVVKGTNDHLSPSKPATRTNTAKDIKSINYSLENQNGTLWNLLNLIEIKEKVNQSSNSNLLGSSEYNQLLNDISMLRNEFDNYVESKGIENCNSSEQSHYLAFLKEEGSEEAYKNAIKNLK